MDGRDKPLPCIEQRLERHRLASHLPEFSVIEAKIEGLPRDTYDAEENLRLALIHLGVDEDIVWQVVTEDLPKLIELLEPLTPPML